jgi:hypothetical protein
VVDTLEELRRRIRAIEGRPAELAHPVASGLPSLDAAGGLPCPGLVGVEGAAGSGRTRLVLTWVAARTAVGERVAWIDPDRLLHPPTAAALGVQLERLLLVRAAQVHAAWAVEQALRSSCFGLVVLSALPELRGIGPVWVQAARQGACTLVVLAEALGEALPLDLRLTVAEGVALVRRRRGAVSGQRHALPVWPEGLDPWAEDPSWG